MSAARFVEQLDTERVTVARACGVPVRTALELLNDAWQIGRAHV